MLGRRKPTINKSWRPGDSVKIGFLRLDVLGKSRDGYYLVDNRRQDYPVRYEFVPYRGLFKMD